jgi:hypothetical protein
VSLRSEWQDLKAGLKALALLPWVVLRDLVKMVYRGLFDRRGYADRRHEILDITRERAHKIKKPVHRPEISISASIAETKKDVRSTLMSIRQPPEPIIDPLVDYHHRIGERIKDQFPDARVGARMAGFTTECVSHVVMCDICGRTGINLLAFSADFSKTGQPFQLLQKYMCKDFEACDIRARDNEAHEEAS